jgi:formylmethanofuran dehydrogenase subunit E
MGGTALSQEQIQRVVDFHGHWCPGLAIGIRAGEFVLREFGRAADEEIVAVVETDMCGVDAIQMLTGCTLGKGNLLHLDHGKMAFRFYRRSDEKGVRLVFDADRLGGPSDAMAALQQKRAAGTLTAEERQALDTHRAEWSERIMGADLADVFRIRPAAGPVPRRARLMQSLACEACGEKTMETRTRRFEGRTLCLPCFERLDRRV